MPVPIVKLPELEYPRNALLDFSGINNAADTYRQQQQFAAQKALDQQRIDIERQRAGYEGERVGIERGQLGVQQGQLGVAQGNLAIAQQNQQQQETERERIRIGNLASNINSMPIGPDRSAAWRGLINSTPKLGEALRAHGQDPFNDQTGPQAIMAFVQDQQQRYQPQIIHGAPGTVVAQVEPGPGGATARPLLTVPQRNQMTMSEVDKLAEEGNTFANINRHLNSFQNSYTDPGVVRSLIGTGNWNNWRGRVDPNAPQQVKDAAQWWQDYQGNTEVALRHGLFGSALTPQEVKVFEQTAITPNMAPDQIRANLDRRSQIAQNHLVARAGAMVAAGQDIRMIARATGVDPDSLARAIQAQQQNPPSQLRASGALQGGQPPAQATGQPQPQNAGTGPAEGLTRRIGGKTYVYRGGQWFEQ